MAIGQGGGGFCSDAAPLPINKISHRVLRFALLLLLLLFLQRNAN